jgi:hypothetical protein
MKVGLDEYLLKKVLGHTGILAPLTDYISKKRSFVSTNYRSKLLFVSKRLDNQFLIAVLLFFLIHRKAGHIS